MFGILLAIVGIIEQIISQLYYKFAQKYHKFLCSIFSMLRVYLWAYVVTVIVDKNVNHFLLITVYAIGSGFGDYITLCFEPFLDKHIVRFKKLNRKKHWKKRSKAKR